MFRQVFPIWEWQVSIKMLECVCMHEKIINLLDTKVGSVMF